MRTKNYIKMCEKAEEIQSAWKPEVGDYVYLKKNKQIYLITNIERKIIFYINIKDGEESWCYQNNFKQYFICLPTQEQLQEIWREVYNEEPGSLAFKNGWIGIFANWVKSLSEFTLIDFNELWLAFVMKEKYNKTWEGNKWNIKYLGKN